MNGRSVSDSAMLKTLIDCRVMWLLRNLVFASGKLTSVGNLSTGLIECANGV